MTNVHGAECGYERLTNWFFFPGPESKTSESAGIIKQVTTEPGVQAGRNVAASEEDPRYEVSDIPELHKRYM